jgi:hypothetical protein
MLRTSEDTLGRRRFQLLREKAVENAIEKIRHAPAAGWPLFSCADYLRLREILGELWIHLAREKWDRYSFSSLTCDDIHAILRLGSSGPGSTFSAETLEEMDAILSHTGSPAPVK